MWYPADAKESPYAYSKELKGSVAVDGSPAACGRFPLVVFSHGMGGCGIQSVFFTEQLARAGYVVAAPDHRDAQCSVSGGATLHMLAPEKSLISPQTWDESTYADRRADLEAVIDWTTRSREFGGMIDAGRIALAGHSLGGYVALGMAGGWPSWTDSRIKALVLFSPYALPFLMQKQKRLAALQIPVMYQGAQFDLGITPFLKGPTGAYAASRTDKIYVELRGGNHFEWTNALCFGQARVADCLAKKPNARLIDVYAGAFLDQWLKGDSTGLRQLRGVGLATLQRGN